MTPSKIRELPPARRAQGRYPRIPLWHPKAGDAEGVARHKCTDLCISHVPMFVFTLGELPSAHPAHWTEPQNGSKEAISIGPG
jgi:hypothetical protein